MNAQLAAAEAGRVADIGWEPLPFPPCGATVFAEALTARERLVLAYVAVGDTLDGVASRLGVSRNTAHTHLKHVYSKLGISNRVEAVVAATRLRLIRL